MELRVVVRPTKRIPVMLELSRILPVEMDIGNDTYNKYI